MEINRSTADIPDNNDNDNSNDDDIYGILNDGIQVIPTIDDKDNKIYISNTEEDLGYQVLQIEENLEKLDSPFISNEEKDNNTHTHTHIDDTAILAEDKSSDEFEITPNEIEEDKQQSEIEIIRQRINVLTRLVTQSKDAQLFANSLESIFTLEVNFELAWNLITNKMKYDSLISETAISLDEMKLQSLKKDLDKIRRINCLIELTRSLGSHTLEEHLLSILVQKEFNIISKVSTKDSQNEILNKLEKMMEQYADKLKEFRI